MLGFLPGNSRLRDAALAALTFLVVLACYWPALNGALLWDDPAHVTRPELRDWAGLLRIWTEPGATQQFYPVLHTAFWIEHRLWGDAPLPYHLLNVLLHSLNSVLLALGLRRLWQWKAPTNSIPNGTEWLAALLIAVHPVCVESVAWISEQKNTLSTAFCLLALLNFIEFANSRRRTSWWIATAFFALAVGTKSVTAVLGPALLVLAWWRHGRLEWRRDVVPLLPWLVLGFAAGLTTAWIEREWIGADGEAYALSWVQRTLLAARCLWFYLSSLAWPSDLTFFPERWDVPSESPGWIAHLAGAIGITIALWLLSKRSRGPLCSWLLYCGALFPALGFFNVFPFAFSYVADHFQYLPAFSMVASIVTAGALAVRRLPVSGYWLLPCAAVIVSVVLGRVAHRESRLYVSNEVLFRANIERNPRSWMAHHILGLELSRMPGRGDEALVHIREAIRLNPDYPDSHLALGIELMKRPGSREEALAAYGRALQLRPYFAEAHSALAVDLAKQPGRLDDALHHFEEALRIRPLRPEIHANYANALARDPARLPKAIAHFEEALHLKPDYAKALNDYGVVLARLPDRRLAAVAKFEQALTFEPGYHEARYNLAATLSEIPGRESDAISQYERILGSDPGFALAHYGVANLLARRPDRAADAIRHYETAIAQQPDFAEAHANLANLLSRIPGRAEDAVAHYETALRIDPGLAWVHFNLALHLAGNPDRAAGAASHYEAALRIDPDYLDALNGLAILLAQQGRFEEARTRWTRALEIDPNYQPARQNLLLLEQMRAQPR